MQRHITALAAGGLLLLLGAPIHAGTPNTTAAGAVSYEIGAGWITDGIDINSQTRWFIYTELASRSYCVEAALGPATYFPLDPSITLYSDSAGTVVYLSNTNGTGEPTQYKGSRVCYQSPLALGTSTSRLYNVNVPVTGTDSGFVRTRVVDTTVIFPIMCLRNDNTGAAKYSATTYVVNTTTIDINAAFYVPGYGAVKTYSGSSILKAPNQSTGKGNVVQSTVTAPSGVVSWTWDGAVYLTHDGPPGSLEAWADTNDACTNTVVRVYAYPR